VRENYAPWGIDVNAFPEKGKLDDQLKFLLGFAILAPSGHNSQPWRFRVEGKKIWICNNPESDQSPYNPVFSNSSRY